MPPEVPFERVPFGPSWFRLKPDQLGKLTRFLCVNFCRRTDQTREVRCGYTLRAPGCQRYGSQRLESREVGHARDIALEFVLTMTPPSQGWSSRWRRRDDHAVRCISVINAVTAVALWTSDACAAAAIRSTSVRSRRSIHHLASAT